METPTPERIPPYSSLFKSYYVVWKQDEIDWLIVDLHGLNRTM